MARKSFRSATHYNTIISIKQQCKMKLVFRVQATLKDKAIKQVDYQKAWHSCHLDRTHLLSRWCLTVAFSIIRVPICNSLHKCRDIRLLLLCRELKLKARQVDCKELTIKDKASHSYLNKYHSMVLWQVESGQMPQTLSKGIRCRISLLSKMTYNTLITRKSRNELSSQQIEIFYKRGRARYLVQKLGVASSEEAFYKSSYQRLRLEQHHKQ